jgi:uncharacterized MAPEG superfamily protein
MTTELTMLCWAVALGVVQYLLMPLGRDKTFMTWASSPRDTPAPPRAIIAGRVDRAIANFHETFPLFAAAALLTVYTQHACPLSATGSQVYFWSRLAYIPCYLFGIVYARSLIWVISLIGIVMTVWPTLFPAV